MFFGKRQRTDEQLHAMILQGAAQREEALRYIYLDSGWYETAKKILLKAGASRADADDALQEALIVLDNHLRNGRYEKKSSLRNFFIGIARGRLYVRRRSLRRLEWTDQPTRPDVPDLLEPEVIMLENEQKEIVRKLLEQLDEKCREAMFLYKTGYSMEEIGIALAIESAGAVRQQVFRCREKLTRLAGEDPVLAELLRS